MEICVFSYIFFLHQNLDIYRLAAGVTSLLSCLVIPWFNFCFVFLLLVFVQQAGTEPQGAGFCCFFFFFYQICPLRPCVIDGLSDSATLLSVPLYPRCSSPPKMKAQMTRTDVICYR
ncbi:hypothetical protein XENORESO_011934 [Xenotaenia resolanae]|uniref:Uncharacterized protein n=1 Tax=Xenotaenia resolanae TaxID=208358 RepID=A0ABV0WAL1_9TELE